MNKAITKRLLSLVLLVVMLVGCALPAYAADTGASGDLTAVYAQEGTRYKDGVYEGTGKGFKSPTARSPRGNSSARKSRAIGKL